MVKVIVVGDWHTELTVQAERLPRPYQTVIGEQFRTGGGGRGAIQAVTAARLDAEVTFIGRVGEDVNAETALKLLRAENIDTAHIVRDETAPTGVKLTFTDPDGRPMSALAAGANQRLSAADIEQCEAAFEDADLLITQLGVPLDAVQKALQLAREHSVKSVFKPTPFTPISPDMLALADVVTPNEEELKALAMNVSQQSAPQGQITVCTLGAKGAQWFQRGEGSRMNTGRVSGFTVRAIDVSGAGDVFSAALGVALAEQQPLEQAIRFANGAAALSTKIKGGLASIPRRAAVDAL